MKKLATKSVATSMILMNITIVVTTIDWITIVTVEETATTKLESTVTMKVD